MAGVSTIDLNADLGEGVADDAALLEVVTSANVACGGHAGDAATMRAVCAEAAARGVAIGAHVSYADKENFGRVDVEVPASSLLALLSAQIQDLAAHASRAGSAVSYVKPHGALYHRAARDAEVAGALVDAVLEAGQSVAAEISLMGMPGAEYLAEAQEAGLAVVTEAFADRAYAADGTLVPRGEPGAVIDSSEDAVSQAVLLARTGTAITTSGDAIEVRAQSLCVHGDTPGAVQLARDVRAALIGAGVTVATFAQVA